MTAHRPQLVRAASIRVALATAGVVAVLYVLIAVAVALIVTRNLTAQIDEGLARSIAHAVSESEHSSGCPQGPPPGEPLFGPTFLCWTVRPDGTVTSNESDAELPDAYEHVIGPQTITIGGEEVRVRGAERSDGGYVVVGQSTRSVSEATSTLVLAEVIIGPILLLVVFAGAVVIGRRVAAPIEEARQRQLEFTADASHELRTPLSVVEAQVTLALQQDRDEAWYRTAFSRVDAESKRMRRLLDDLLWLARFDATRGQPHAEPVDLGVLAEQTVDRFRIVAEARHLELGLRADPGAQVVTAPPEWLDRLLGVLLDNACRYSPEGGSVVVSVTEARGRIRLAVEDSGPGIPADERERIFDRFHRATQTPGGAGLGLAIADAIVKATGGRWTIGSAAAGGASMAVSWARAFSGPREASTSNPAQAAHEPTLR